MKRKHIIFDLDGTLSNTAKATFAATEEGTKKHGLPVVSYEKILEAMGIAGLDFYALLYPKASKEELQKIEQIINPAEERMIKQLGEEILFPDIIEMLEALDESGHTIYIASTGSQSHVHTTLEATWIGEFFAEVHCGRPEKVSMVKEIIKGRDPSQWAMVGDMYKDSEAAKGNNILAIGAGFGYLAKEDEKLFDKVIAKPMDIMKL